MPSNPEVERRIAARFAALRSLRGLSMSGFAKEIGLTKGQVSNIQRARSPLRYLNARRALQALAPPGIHVPHTTPFNPIWLFGISDWPIQLEWPMLLPEPVSIGLDLTIRFSQFVEDHLALLQVFASDNPENARLPESWLKPYALHWLWCHHRVARARRGDSTLFDIIGPSAQDKAGESSDARRVLEWIKQPDSGMASVGHKPGIRMHEPAPQANENKSPEVLTGVSEYGKREGMKSPMLDLLNRLKRATSQPGSKTVLADYMKVKPANISQWLHGHQEPSGGTALRLLHWVEQQEAQQKQSPGSVSAPPRPTTQSKKANEKQSKSGLPKT